MITKQDKKHIFLAGMCALLCTVISIFTLNSEKYLRLQNLIFYLITFCSIIYYVIKKIKFYKLSNLYITEDQLSYLGFRSIPHFTIGDNRIKDLGRNRFLSISSLGTPNEMLWICEHSIDDNRYIEEIICLHNYDFDGYLTYKNLKKYCKTFPKLDENGFSRKK